MLDIHIKMKELNERKHKECDFDKQDSLFDLLSENGYYSIDRVIIIIV